MTRMQSPTNHFDAVIVGAGPAGSTAAILLARAGWSVALVEKQRFPRRKVCGECLAASNLPLLDALGLGAVFKALAGPPLRRLAVMHAGQVVEADLPSASDPVHAWGRALGRETLDKLMLEQAKAAGVVVWQPWSVQALSGSVGDHQCKIRCVDSGEIDTIHASVLIAAHGSWEALPSGRSQRRFARAPGDLFAFKANFEGGSLADGLLPVLSFKGGYGGMVVGDQGTLTLACCVRQDRLDALRAASPGQTAGDVVEAMLKRECQGVADALATARRCGSWLASGPIDPGVRLRGDDTLFRIGNAAGEAHPIIGEGMSMAMQSAWLLCAALLSHPVPAGALIDAQWQTRVRKLYHAQWRHHFASRLRLASAFAHIAMRPAICRPLLAGLSWWPSLLTQGARWGGKIDCAASPASIAWLAAGASQVSTQAKEFTP